MATVEAEPQPSTFRAQGLICIRGARTHNLKNVDVDLPQHALGAITWLSGSGESSLPFDARLADGQRRDA